MEESRFIDFSKELMEFIDKSPSAFHVTANFAEMLKKNGYSQLNEQDKWIVANYKETQLRHIIPGCTVEIEVDAVPNVIFKGKVCSVSQATGASLSLLPQDNSAGNFVKVEQRVPVKIEFSDENDPEAVRLLRAGMNVECTICY